MELERMLKELREERDAVEEAIIALERLARGTGHRGGRRPRWLATMLQQAAAERTVKPRTTRVTKAPMEHAAAF